MLSADDLAHYREHGYLLLRALFPAEALARFDARFRALVEDPATQPRSLTVVRDVMIAKGAVRPASPLHAINKLLNFEDDPEDVWGEVSVGVNLADPGRNASMFT
ncbi:MAG: hypothetical protein ABFS41_12545, partial [Myxococcota bacterium]